MRVNALLTRPMEDRRDLAGRAASLTLTRPMLGRLIHIMHLIRYSGKSHNARTLAWALEVSQKTIHRDLDFLRDVIGVPLEFDSARNEWFLRDQKPVAIWL